MGLLTSKAQETGISVDKLESYVLDNNSAFKEMGLSLPQAINLMAQFDANGVDSTTALAGLKKALQNATAEGKSMDVALEETIGSIKNAKTDTEALQIATELFGKKGAAEMATAIRENRIDLTSLSSSMSEYGTTVEDTYNGTATITLKKGTTAEWTESKRVLDDGELGLETTTSGHRIIRIGNGSTEFMSLPVAFDIEEVREIKTGMDKDAKTYYDDMVKKGTELLAEMKALATTVELEDDATQIKYRMGISNGTLYFEEITKEASE